MANCLRKGKLIQISCTSPKINLLSHFAHREGVGEYIDRLEVHFLNETVYISFQAITLRKGMNPNLLSSATDK